jgi:hypothetical protein
MGYPILGQTMANPHAIRCGLYDKDLTHSDRMISPSAAQVTYKLGNPLSRI